MNTGERRAWRKLVKKERRRRLRRKAAQDRDADAERLRATVERAAEFSTWVQQNREEEILQEQERLQKEQEWLQEELRAQEEWRSLQERREKARLEKLEQEEMIRKEYEAKQEALRKKQAEEKQRIDAMMKKQKQMKKVIDDYIDEGAKTPPVLRAIVETQPGKDICQFYSKTGACRYGDLCSRNHQKTSLSKVILMPGFYSHYSLEKNSYDADASLEYDSAEVRKHFEEFYNDVVPELESFGKIKTLKYCSNTELHLRGNLYVEYYTEREAARAVRKLKGRWFARRQINCEFTGIKSWRTAICGMSRCPKGRACNFLHVFRNPGNEYDVRSPPRWVKRLESQDSSWKEVRGRRSDSSRLKSNWDDSTREDVEGSSRNWRWDSPESESDDRKGESTRRRYSDDRHKSSRLSNSASSRRSRNHDERSSRDLLDFSDEEYQSSRRNSSGRSRRPKHESRNGDASRRRRRESEKSEYGRYSSRSKYSSYSRSDRHGREKNRSHEREKEEEGVPKIGEKDLKSRASDDDDDESCKISKRKIDLNVKSKWDEDTSNPKAEVDSPSSASSSPSSSSSSASSSSSSASSSSKRDSESKVVKRELESERAVDPEPKRHKVPEYYDWDTTDSEQ